MEKENEVAEEATEKESNGELLNLSIISKLIDELNDVDLFNFIIDTLVGESKKRRINICLLPPFIDKLISEKIGHCSDIPLVKELNELGIVTTIAKTEDDNIEIILGNFGTWSKNTGFIVNESINYRLTDNVLGKCLAIIDKHYEDTKETINKLKGK